MLDSTLVVFAHKIGDAITVVTDFDRSLPAIPVYAAELNQVWTNLIDNAVLSVESSPGNTRFIVRLPLVASGLGGGLQ